MAARPAPDYNDGTRRRVPGVVKDSLRIVR